MEVHLHVGAHKTATTFIQSSLAANINSLHAAGVGYMPLGQFRRKVTSQLMQLPAGKFKDEESLSMFFSSGMPKRMRGVIMSDENLIGSPMEFVRSGVPYQDAAIKLRSIRNALGPNRPVKLFFSIRSYDSFIASNYCEASRHTRLFTRFGDFRSTLNLPELRWPKILDQIILGLKPMETYVWRYEDFRAHNPKIIQDLAFGEHVGLDSTDNVRPSFSQTAIDLLTVVADRHGPEVAGRVVNGIGDLLPKSSELGEFDPWTASQKKYFKDIYAEDCQKLPVKLLTF